MTVAGDTPQRRATERCDAPASTARAISILARSPSLHLRSDMSGLL
jgi:hypothetical protein